MISKPNVAVSYFRQHATVNKGKGCIAMALEIINSSNVARLEELHTLRTSSSVYSLAFSPNSSILAIGRDDNIELWQVARGSILGKLPFGWTGGKGEFAFHPTDNTVVGVSGNIVNFSLW